MYFKDINVIDIGNLINQEYEILAHKKQGEKEPLEKHIELCLKYFFRIIDKKEANQVFKNIEQQLLSEISKEGIQLYKEMIVNMVILHDAGKINPYFQKQRLDNNLKIKDADKYKNSHHSMLSSIIYINYYYSKIREFKGEERNTLLDFMMMNAYVISRHHGELNSLEEFKEKFALGGEGEKLLEDQRVLFEVTYNNKITITIKIIENIFKVINKKKAKDTKDISIYKYIYERLMLSFLFACDFYSTSEFMDGIDIKDMGVIEDIEEFYNVYKDGEIYKAIRDYEKESYKQRNDFSNIKDINVLRNEMFLDAERNMLENIQAHIFYLEAPTGSGKSNVATNLSFRLLEEDKAKNKIFYVYPFNTLVEQNINTLQKTFKEEKNIFNKIAVINSIEPIKMEKELLKNEDEDAQLEYYKSALLNRQFLNYPMILTTHVTIFKYLFGTSKEDIFPLYQLVNSIIVLDEVQSYKNLLWGEIITFLTAYAKLLNIKIIIMSATLPDLNKLTLSEGKSIRLLEDRDKYFKNPIFKNRVQVNYKLLSSKNVLEDLYISVKEKSRLEKKILVEFISKNSAYEFYNKLKEDKEILSEIELMTGDDNIGERDRILTKVKESQNIILIATQVVEAGVDIDMDIGFKNMSLFDSEEQFLGRINRSCKKENCVVYFFKIDEAKTIYKEDIRNNQDLTLLREDIREFLINKDFQEYYEKVIERLKAMTGGINKANIEDFFNGEVKKLDFKKVEERMKLIKEEDSKISVYLSSNLVIKGEKLSGDSLWQEYREVLADNNMDYSKQRVLLSKIRAEMNNFIYEIRWKCDFTYNDRLGELYYIEDGYKYFKDGKLDKEKFKSGIGDFI